MLHCDPETLALRAVGEPAGDAVDDRHLAECARCRAELDELTAVVTTARGVEPDDRPAPAPADVWTVIATETGHSAGGGNGPDPASTDQERPAPASATPLPDRRRRAWPLVAAAAVMGLLLGGLGVAVWDRQRTTTPPGDVVARATLDPLPGSGARGSAAVLRTSLGSMVSVDVTGLPTADGYYEVWLLNPSATRLIALGTIAPGQEAVFSVPTGVTVEDFPIVDVSLEPPDGDPGHSSDSKCRGTLTV